jgi:5'-methylthioinosine phosphorylase
MSLDLALIGGTGLYQLPGLEQIERRSVATPYGDPSGEIVVGRLYGKRVGFLARHGEKHSIPPHRVNYRANVWALHELGARRVLGINAVGGITSKMGPRVVAIAHQIIDYTHGRLTSYCDVDGAEVRHIDFSEPYTESLRQALLKAASASGVSVVDGGVYGATQGPRLESVAEIARMARDGCDLVGMTGMPEAVLARELDLEYACVALVANWAAGCSAAGVGLSEPPISLDEIFENLRLATAAVPALLRPLLDA